MRVSSLKLLIIVLLAAPAVWAAPPKPNPGGKRAECVATSFLQAMRPAMAHFNEVANTASKTARSRLQAPIAEMRKLREEAGKLEYPPCASVMRDPGLSYMDATISYFDESRKGNKEGMTVNHQAREERLAAYLTGMTKLR